MAESVDVGAEVDALRAEIADLKERLKKARTPRPSFRAMHALDARLVKHVDQLGPGRDRRPPRFGLADKVRGRRIATASGVAVPQLLAQWERLSDVRFGDLPDRFVFKSVGGAASTGVYPLRRTGHETYRMVTSTDDRHFAEIISSLSELADAGKVRPPFIAEELIPGQTPDDLPDDIKFYTFYGEVGHVLVRHVDAHVPGRSVYRSKYLDVTGKDLGNVNLERETDSSIPTPERWDELVATAKRLSLATRLPFVRVDLYSTARGVYFGEFTPRPGGRQRYRQAHDVRLGEMWERAIIRLEADVAAGVPLRHALEDDAVPDPVRAGSGGLARLLPRLRSGAARSGLR